VETGKSFKFEEIIDKNKFIEIINEYLNCVLGDEDDIRLPRLMRVPSLIHKTSVLALLDSGSQASILSLLSIFRMLPNKYRKSIVKEIETDLKFKLYQEK
jgi:hypothetical protein